ncbi:hypothetical protein SLEP1_g37939 [Rubroshorea leprosula]|uniref:Transposase (putative) gypsy type domain-containing protein n=1 Tax=Rubroshorea leprosula TaxID=152421 RepID=A0AAV5KWU5_9ROSI|nr:hypothetical protein SLEP1_g37939 [Rubroshorea leprosula]
MTFLVCFLSDDAFCSCRKLGGTPDLKSSLRLSCKASKLVLGVETPMLKSAIIRTTSYGARVKAEFEVGFQYLSEMDPEGSGGCTRVDPSEKPGQHVSNIAGASHEGLIAKISSEGTLSVGGEERVRDVTSSSVSTSSSSSSSGGGNGGGTPASGGNGGRTPTSGGNGGRTPISGGSGGQEGSLVPTNILEVGNNWGRCYDESDEVVEEVVGYESCWRCRGELGHLVENYTIPPHVLVRPVRGEERACSAPKDHWMPLYAHYLVAGLRFPIPELLVALLKEYGLGLTQLVPNGVRLVVGFLVYCQLRGVRIPTVDLFKYFFIIKGGNGRDKGWFYFTPRVVGGRSRNLFTAGPFSIKGWKEKFIFVDDTEWGRGDGEVEELSRWKGKRRNPNQYRLGEVEKDEVKRLERGGGELANIMYLTNLEVVESSGIYGRSSLSREEMNRLRAGGKQVRLPEKRSRASAPGAQEERVGGEASRPRAEIEAPIEFVPRPAPMQIDPELRETEVVAPGRGKSSVPYPRQVANFYNSGRTAAKRFIGAHFLEVDLQRAKDELAANGGSRVVLQDLETTNLVNAMVVEFFDCLQERIALVKKNEKLNHQKEEAKKNFSELTSELERVREELANSRRSAELEEQKRRKCEEALGRKENKLAEVKKSAELAVHNSVEEHVSDFVKSATFAEVVDLYRLPTLVMAFADCGKKVKEQNPEVDVTSITFGPEEAGVEENGDSKTAEFRPEVKLTWERDEAGKTILPPTLDFEFVAVDEEEAEVAPRTEVADNIRNEEVDQQLQIID